jgi:hypothetical protein
MVEQKANTRVDKRDGMDEDAEEKEEEEQNGNEMK